MLKRFAILFASLGAIVFGANMVAAQDYPPGAPTVSISGSPGPVGSTFTVMVDDCIPGEAVTAELPANGDGPVTVACSEVSGAGFFLVAAGGSAMATLDHASTPGTNTGTAELEQSDVTLTFTVETTAAAADGGTGGATLPSTGSDSTASILLYGGAAIAVGAAMVLIAVNRRRDAHAPTT